MGYYALRGKRYTWEPLRMLVSASVALLDLTG
jgi:hypothetical protein